MVLLDKLLDAAVIVNRRQHITNKASQEQMQGVVSMGERARQTRRYYR